MPLFVTGLLWLAMALRACNQPSWWFWLALIALFAALRWKLSFSIRQIASALIPVALIFGFTQQATEPNPQLARVAESFETKTLRLVSDGDLRFGHLPVRILGSSAWGSESLAGSATLVLKQTLPDCTSVELMGDFLITPPSGLAVSSNQATLRQIGPAKVTCLSQPLDWFRKPGEIARTKTAQAVTGVSKDATALVLGLTDGDTRLLSDTLNLKLKFLSLTHLNAVSGANCAIVVASAFGFLALIGCGRRIRILGSLFALGAYLVLVGNQPSVIRAGAMACIALISLATGKRNLGQNVLAAAVCILLAIWPQLAINFGFALSALATWGVIVLAPRIHERLQRVMPEWLSLMIAVSFSAQIACLPVLVLLQSRFSWFSTLANILVEPAVPLITVFGVLGALFAQVWSPLASLPFWLASVPAQYLVAVTNFFAAIPSTVIWPAGALGAALALALGIDLVGFIFLKNRFRFVGLASALVVVLAFTGASASSFARTANFANGNWFWVSCDVGQGDASVIRSQGQIAVIDVGREPEPVDSCLKRLGISHVNLLVLTHFDLDHVGGLSGLVSGRKVDGALLSSFKDDRPGAEIAERTLDTAGIPVRHVSRGLKGTLGDFSWLVLSPHFAGADSTDSNDGSVTMFFHSRKVNIVTLADLPESGQLRLAQERLTWWKQEFREQPLVMKVSHHGSADQSPEFVEWLHPRVALFSVGAGNSYGHPTQKTLRLLETCNSLILRTDLQGNLSLNLSEKGIAWASSGVGG